MHHAQFYERDILLLTLKDCHVVDARDCHRGVRYLFQAQGMFYRFYWQQHLCLD